MPVVFCIAVFKTLSYSCFVKIFTLLQVCKVPFALKFQILTLLFYLNSKDCDFHFSRTTPVKKLNIFQVLHFSLRTN